MFRQRLEMHRDILGGITELFRPGFSKTWVLI